MPIHETLESIILLNYGQSVDEASLINGIQNKETIQLKVKGDTIPLSASAIAENWVRVVFKQDNINYTYETGKGWHTYTSRSDLIVKLGNLSEEVKEKIDSAKELPSGGNEGDVLTMGTNNKPEWADDNEEFEISISFDGDTVWSVHTGGEDIINAYLAGKKLYARTWLLLSGETIGRADVVTVMGNPNGQDYWFYFSPINLGSGDEFVVPIILAGTTGNSWYQNLYQPKISLPGVSTVDAGKYLGVDSNGVWDVVNSPYQEFLIGVSTEDMSTFTVNTDAQAIVNAIEAKKQLKVRLWYSLLDVEMARLTVGSIMFPGYSGGVDTSYSLDTCPVYYPGKGFIYANIFLGKSGDTWTATASMQQL